MPTRLVRRLLLPVVLLCTVFGVATPAFATDPDTTDQWIRWQGSPQDAWVRSLDFIGPLLFAGAEGEGVFSSPTAIGPWSQDNGGLTTVGAKTVHQVKVSPSGVVFAATGDGLFSSPAGTGNWTQVGGGTGPRKLNMGGIQSIVFDDPSGMNMTVAVAGAGGPGVYNSSDGGANWDKAAGMPTGENVYYLTSGISPTPMYAAADDGVFTSLDLGRHWTLTSDGIPPGETTLRVAVSPTNPAYLYASTSSNVYASKTAGLKWSEASGTGSQSLPAGGKRAFLLLPALNGKFGENRAVVGTDSGVYGTLDDGAHWGPMSPSTVTPNSATPMKDRVVWALGLGFTTPVLMAGTQGFGVFNIAIQPITGGAPAISPTAQLKPGDKLTITNDDPTKQHYMGFNGTRPYFFTYQWLRCAVQNCTPSTPIDGATDNTYTVPDDDAGAFVRYAVKVTGRNLVSPNPLTVTSAVSSALKVAAAAGTEPKPLSGLDLSQSPSGQPYLGTTFTVVPGTWRTEASASQITPTDYDYRWQRCLSGTCTTIPGATGASYKTVPADIGYSIVAYISASGPSPGLVRGDEWFVKQSSTILNKYPVSTVAPKVVGNAYTGETLSSSAGGWDGYEMTFSRRWIRCDADGLGCNAMHFPDQTGATYTVTPADLGSRIEVEVTATAADPNQNRVTVATSVATAVVTDPPPVPVDTGSVVPIDTPVGGTPVGGGGTVTIPGSGGPAATPTPTPQAVFSVPVSLPKTLKASSSISVPKTVAGFSKISYQWLRNGKPIKKATKRTYKFTKADRGKTVTCRITLTPASGGAKVVTVTAPVKVPKK